jgi:hypothetical protein
MKLAEKADSQLAAHRHRSMLRPVPHCLSAVQNTLRLRHTGLPPATRQHLSDFTGTDQSSSSQLLIAVDVALYAVCDARKAIAAPENKICPIVVVCGAGGHF